MQSRKEKFEEFSQKLIELQEEIKKDKDECQVQRGLCELAQELV